MDGQGCPRCKSTKFTNPNLKLLVNVCGHTLCDHCVELLFVRGTGSCPECGTALKRSNFKLQMFEDAWVAKEVDVRKRVLKDFNKKEEDFATLREYNDYLEEVETIIFNLTNNIDVEETKKKIEQYRKENKELIIRNRTTLSKDEEFIELMLEQEKEDKQLLRQQVQEEEKEQRRERVKARETLIDELMFSDKPANQIVAVHQKEQETKAEKPAVPKERATKFSTGIKMGKRDVFLPVPTQKEIPCYEYEALIMDVCGPHVPDGSEVLTHGYMNHMRAATDYEKGGGFGTEIACQRAIQEAFCGLFYVYTPREEEVPSSSAVESMDMR